MVPTTQPTIHAEELQLRTFNIHLNDPPQPSKIQAHSSDSKIVAINSSGCKFSPRWH